VYVTSGHDTVQNKLLWLAIIVFHPKQIPLPRLMESTLPQEAKMNEDILNLEIRKYLKQYGVTSQREFEHAVLKAIETGKIKGSEALDFKMTLDVPALGVNHCIEGKIALE
jgi:hypothetical protein